MDVYDTYFVVTRRLMTSLGIWLYQDPKEQFPRKVFVTSFILLAIAIEIFSVLSSELTIQNIVESLKAIIPTLSISWAYFVAILHFDEVKYSFEQITYDWAHVNNLEELKIMKSYARQTRRYTLIFTAVMYGSVVLILGPPVLYAVLDTVGLVNGIEMQELPVRLEYYLDKKKYYHLLLLHQCITVVLLFTCAAATYAMFFVLVQHACSVFRMISTSKNTEKWVYNCIHRYTRNAEFVANINKCVELCYLSRIILSMILVSISILHAFQLSGKFNGLVDFIYNCSCIPGPIVCSYITCYIGQKLIDHSADVFLAACQLSYYDTTQKVQKLLLFLLMRTSKPCSLSIGKMFVSSHEFFTATIQTSFSYAMMIYTFK